MSKTRGTIFVERGRRILFEGRVRHQRAEAGKKACRPGPHKTSDNTTVYSLIRQRIWETASSESTQAFLLIGTLLLLPIILMYTAWSYWVFRGKVRGDVGYH